MKLNASFVNQCIHVDVTVSRLDPSVSLPELVDNSKIWNHLMDRPIYSHGLWYVLCGCESVILHWWIFWQCQNSVSLTKPMITLSFIWFAGVCHNNIPFVISIIEKRASKILPRHWQTHFYKNPIFVSKAINVCQKIYWICYGAKTMHLINSKNHLLKITNANRATTISLINQIWLISTKGFNRDHSTMISLIWGGSTKE